MNQLFPKAPKLQTVEDPAIAEEKARKLAEEKAAAERARNITGGREGNILFGSSNTGVENIYKKTLFGQ